MIKQTTIIIIMLLSWSASLLAVTPEELKAARAEGERITIIDIRDTGSYRTCHIASAMNVPLTVLKEKSLPELGRVAVCGDGVDAGAVAKAVEILNAKDGINAEPLEGGMLRWAELGYRCSGAKGFARPKTAGISYQQLKKVLPASPNLVLVDLRQSGNTAARAAFSDLNEHFPGARRTSTPFAGAGRSASTSDVYVLIDNGDGEAQKIAHKLRGAGIRRFVILLGGEEMIKRRGAPDSVRTVVD
jgi:rhodanese-related sulfurtransferase